jgi:hypothetical protein
MPDTLPATKKGEDRKMIVNYKRAGAWVIQHGQMVDAPFDQDGKRILKKVFSGRNIVLVPGLNTIKNEVWEELYQNPDVQAKIQSGILEVVESEVSTGKKKSVNDETIESLEKMDIKQAISVVEGQMDKQALMAWKKKEKRPQVLKAIKEQAEKISKADEAFDNKE